MAYVALSRVRSLAGLHLIAFNPQSVRVSVKSLREISRLRKEFRVMGVLGHPCAGELTLVARRTYAPDVSWGLSCFALELFQSVDIPIIYMFSFY